MAHKAHLLALQGRGQAGRKRVASRALFVAFFLVNALLAAGCDDPKVVKGAASGHGATTTNSRSGGAPGDNFPKETARSLEPLHYLTFELGGAEAGEALPTLIAIHGLGDTPENFSHWLRGFNFKLRLIVPQAPATYGHGYSWFPYRPERTQHELAQGIRQSRDRLEQLLDELGRRFEIHGKPAVLGFSQGGMLSFALAAHAPERFSLVMPLGGLLPSELDPEPMTIPASRPEVLAFHGTDDRIVPYADAARTTKRLSALGYAVHLNSYAGVGHQIPPDMREAVFAKLREWALR